MSDSKRPIGPAMTHAEIGTYIMGSATPNTVVQQACWNMLIAQVEANNVEMDPDMGSPQDQLKLTVGRFARLLESFTGQVMPFEIINILIELLAIVMVMSAKDGHEMALNVKAPPLLTHAVARNAVSKIARTTQGDRAERFRRFDIFRTEIQALNLPALEEQLEPVITALLKDPTL